MTTLLAMVMAMTLTMTEAMTLTTLIATTVALTLTKAMAMTLTAAWLAAMFVSGQGVDFPPRPLRVPPRRSHRPLSPGVRLPSRTDYFSL